ncbi:MAG: hypothetical protein OMM_03459 [Candidatus Magnetoglobus multicellularis str. Araruama]|uniref:Uncharacterized protein n=1 Tax=Candidatus Magnetoglobus multicellularis str. Araruama TaxID=890399 RepID=A0A1V1P5U5_9BACT|nr:MAG: hypothetical protein OMM_03459 [Candidatus Magnetoglobus multicellularis str. Araruama]
MIQAGLHVMTIQNPVLILKMIEILYFSDGFSLQNYHLWYEYWEDPTHGKIKCWSDAGDKCKYAPCGAGATFYIENDNNFKCQNNSWQYNNENVGNNEIYCIQFDTCGDGFLSIYEECDDGNRVNGDGCTVDCRIEQVEIKDIHLIEREALIDLYYSTNGDNWSNNFKWLGGSGSECSWYGVICDDFNHIKALHLYTNNLNGTIPISIKNLIYLNSLILHNNKLTGNCPKEVFQLEYLDSITLNNNNFTNNLNKLAIQYVQEELSKWDIKNDKKIGIEEAIHALQKSSGIK